MFYEPSWMNRIGGRRLLALVAAIGLVVGGCGGPAGTTPAGTNPDEGLTDNGGTPLSSKGVLSGTVAETRSTRDSVDSTSAGQTLPLSIDTTGARVTFETLDGQPLVDAQGVPHAPALVDASGAFTAQGLPVGIDFVIVIDLDGDDTPDVTQVVQIPADDSGVEGRLDDVVVDPLTTLVVAQLRHLLDANGVDVGRLDVSPTAIVARLVDAFVHLFEESGIERTVTLDDIANLSDANLEALFEALIPPAVRTGFDTVKGNLDLERAAKLEEVVRAAAEVFIRAGFPIADGPEGFDLSFLGDLPNVEQKSIDALFPPDDRLPEPTGPGPDGIAPAQVDLGFDGFLTDGSDAPAELTDFINSLGDLPPSGGDSPRPDFVPPTVYVSTVTEPDRNFVGTRDFETDEPFHRLPILHEHLLVRMAKMHLEGRGITLRSLYRLLTDPEVGLGARLTYASPEMRRDGPPAMVFETADGRGVEIDMEALMFGLSFAGLDDPAADIDRIEQQEGNLRTLLRRFFKGTVPPAFRRLFGAFVSDRIESVDQLFEFIRRSRAHLPFSRSGPATFYVVADGDPFNPDNVDPVNPITVDAEFDAQDVPVSVVYNTNQQGKFYLGFTHETEDNSLVELLIRETGRSLRGPHGEPLFLHMDNAAVFGPINGVPFVDFVSDRGTFFPGVPVNVPNPKFRFVDATHDRESDITPAEFQGDEFGPTIHLFVLATEPGFAGEPVRVDYNIADGTFPYNPNGRYYVIFVPETAEQGVFGLYDIDLSFMPSVHDLEAGRFIDIPDEFPTDVPVLEDLDGDGFPADVDPDDNDPSVIPGDLISDLGLIDEDGDGFPADIDPDDTDATIVPTDITGTLDPSAPQVLPGDGFTQTGDAIDPGLTLDPVVFEPVLISPDQILGLDTGKEFFSVVFGTEVPNVNFDPAGNPYFDDVNGNGIEDEGEFTSDWRPILWDPSDWRATDITRYYRRAGGGAISIENVDFDSQAPRALDGEELVARRYLPRLNAFRFGRPNAAINLLTTFLPPRFLNGTQGLNEDTEIGIFQAIAMINLVMEQVFNVEAHVDIDGPGPLPPTVEVIDAQLFVVPIGDPFVLLLDGFDQLSTVPDQQ